MAKDTKTQRFRDSATEEQWKELVIDYETLPSDDFKNKYGFTWSSIYQTAVERGYYQKKKNTTTAPSLSANTKAHTFIIDDIPEDIKSISRSVSLYEDVVNRLNKLENSKRQYTKKAILNQLLSDALSYYGY